MRGDTHAWTITKGLPPLALKLAPAPAPKTPSEAPQGIALSLASSYAAMAPGVKP